MAYQTRPAHPPQDPTARIRAITRIRAGFGLRGPRREQHVLTADQLGALSFPVGDDGVLIGEDQQRRPAVLGLFRPTAYDVVLVGGVWTAQLIALRAAATGARIAVETARPQFWAPLAQAAGGGQPCMTVHPFGRLGPQGASVSAPVLVVRDLGAKPPRSRLSAGPWQSTLTLLPHLGPNATRVLNAADLVGVQRVAPPEAELIGRVLSLGVQEIAALPTLGDDFTLWATRIRRQFIRLEPGTAEGQLLGGPRRMD
ncbi:hypothetical protein P3T36_006547 [Kitasatospora sp. MAP12-15]|uniref:hypothetical protein n=1 Tax=unclassified Kitasatospora TaxID=2633591 RepID=UPI002475A9EF|nr:hypothetical protein [Kitasatospora sp. MAP12-44]MDH6113184.1 hypothetical protein [Kitasatospora sp. MAP12-44]